MRLLAHLRHRSGYRSVITALALLSTLIQNANRASCQEAEEQGRIVFTSMRDGNGEVYVMNGDGSGQSRLTKEVALDQKPTLSADGKRIAWESYRAGSASIFLMNANGTEQKRVASGRNPAFSPDGQRIVFSSEEESNVFTVNLDGSDAKALTHGKGGNTQPVYSLGGHHLAFVSDRDYAGEPYHRTEIYLMNADGSGQQRITNLPGEKSNPSWSPDGRSIAFDSTAPGEGGYGSSLATISIIDRDDNVVRQLTPNTLRCQHPSWSRGGKRIVFSATARDTVTNEPPGLFVINRDGSGLKRLTQSFDQDPSWGRGDPIKGLLQVAFPPDPRLPALTLTPPENPLRRSLPFFNGEGEGQLVHLWFDSDIDPSLYSSSDKIYLALRRRDEGNRDNTLWELKGLGGYSGTIEGTPRFSPDGQNVLLGFVRRGREFERAAFYVWNLAGQRLVALPSRLLDGTFLSWSPDSNFLLFMCSDEDHRGQDILLLVDRRTGREWSLPREVPNAFAQSWLAPHALLYSRAVTTSPATPASGRPELFLFSPDTNSSRLLLRDAFRPTASPDGQWIAFFGSENVNKPFPLNSNWQVAANYSALCVVRRDGSGRKALFVQDHGPYAASIWRDATHLLTVNWARGGKAASTDSFDIKEWDVTTGRWQRLPALAKVDWRNLAVPSIYQWQLSPDGQFLLLPTSQRLQTINLQTDEVVTIVQFQGAERFTYHGAVAPQQTIAQTGKS